MRRKFRNKENNMKTRTALLIPLLLAFLSIAFVACGSKPATVSDIPVYSGASALEPGQDRIADTLIQNMEQDASVRANLGVGGNMEQKAYRLPKDSTWEQVKSFYEQELAAAGWKSGVGGPGGSLASGIMESASAGNPLFQTALWSRGKQTLTLVRSVDPTNESGVYLIMSLNTN
jgi:hypothetical protein